MYILHFKHKSYQWSLLLFKLAVFSFISHKYFTHIIFFQYLCLKLLLNIIIIKLRLIYIFILFFRGVGFITFYTCSTYFVYLHNVFNKNDIQLSLYFYILCYYI